MFETINGTISTRRENELLLNPDFRIDDRSFSEILNYIVSYLKHINYYNLNNVQDSTWNEIEDEDSVMLLSVIINESIQKLNHLDVVMDNPLFSEGDIKNNLDDLVAWYNKINEWKNKLLSLKEDALAVSIENIQNDVLKDHFNFLIKISHSDQEERFFIKEDKSINANRIVEFKAAAHAIKKIVLHIKKIALSHLQNTLYTSEKHKAHNALYIAFSLLFRNLQDDINTLNKRHLDYYYKNILNQVPDNGIPTRAIVSFDLLPTVQYSLIKSGTKLSAGKILDSESDVLFQTVKPLVAYQVKLEELQTLFLPKSPYIKIGTNKPTVSAVKKNTLLKEGKVVQDPDQWYLFGANKSSLIDTTVNASQTIEIGFVISSPVLMLSEGVREITITINLNQALDISAQDNLWDLIDQIKNSRGISFETAFSELFDDGLVLSYTTIKGWEKIKSYSVDFDTAHTFIQIKVLLELSDPGLLPIANDSELILPSIKVALNDYAPVYLYSFLTELKVSTIVIDADVSRVRDLALYNNIGEMPLGEPFDIFGPLPKVGSYFMLGKSELFQKNVSRVEVIVDWDNLPPDFGGLETYYDAYSVPITNDSFKVSFSLLSNYYWNPTKNDESNEYDLFSVNDCLTPEGYSSVKLNESSVLNVEDFSNYIQNLDYDLKDPLQYSYNSSAGFLKFTLSAPSIAFGFDLYTKDFTAVATYNAKNKTQIGFPNKPFVPKVKEIYLNYVASDVISFDSSKKLMTTNTQQLSSFFHLTPFGLEDIVHNNVVYKDKLVCDFESEAYLYLAISGVSTTLSLTIYFDFLRSSTTSLVSESTLSWSYYLYDKWVDFNPQDLLSDGTNGFVKSGIVELVLRRIDTYETESEDGLYWIRVAVSNNAQHYPKIRGIYFNVIESVCISEDSKVIGKSIPSGTINKLEEKNSDLKGVCQPKKSYGGKIPELENEFYTRVSERLRHKSRAVSIWDFERLVLNRFNEVSLAKCTNLNAEGLVVPGSVKVIVLSDKWSVKERYYFDNGFLFRVQDYLKQYANSFINIQVINPTVEYLIVSCVIELMPEDNGGYYLNLLNEEIITFLSPNLSTTDGVGGIGGYVMPSMLISQIEHLSYVKAVKSLVVEHVVVEENEMFSLGEYSGSVEITSSKPWAILTPAVTHKINTNVNNVQSNSAEVGIGNMILGLDFILADQVVKKEEEHISEKSPIDSILLINRNLN